MSQFWVATDPPEPVTAIANMNELRDWCEAEVETACRDLMANIKIVAACDYTLPKEDGLELVVLLETPWDDVVDSSRRGLCDILLDEADSITRSTGSKDDRDVWIDAGDFAALGERLDAMEATIAKIRAMVR